MPSVVEDPSSDSLLYEAVAPVKLAPNRPRRSTVSQHRVELREASADLVAGKPAAIRPATFLHRGCHQAIWLDGLPRLDPRAPSPAIFFEMRDAGLFGAERYSTTSATKHNYEHAPDGSSSQTKAATFFCSLATNDALRRLSFEV